MPNQILIITGDASDAKVLKEVLARASDGPYAVEWVTQLSDALKRMRAGGIDAMLVDLSLPDSKGIDTFDQLFALAPRKATYQRDTLAAIWYRNPCAMSSSTRPSRKQFSSKKRVPKSRSTRLATRWLEPIWQATSTI